MASGTEVSDHVASRSCVDRNDLQTEQWAASQLIGLTMEIGPVAIVRECCSSALDHLSRVLKVTLHVLTSLSSGATCRAAVPYRREALLCLLRVP